MVFILEPEDIQARFVPVESLEDSDKLSAPGIIAAEIIEDLQAALEQFREIADDLGVASIG